MTCPPMQDLGLSQNLMRAIRSLYDTRRLHDARSDQRRELLQTPVRALRATAGFAYYHEGDDWNAKIRSFDGIASLQWTTHKSQNRPSSAPRAGGPPGIPRSPSLDAGGGQSQASKKVQKSASRPWSARSARSARSVQTRATSATSLLSFSKEDAVPRSDTTGEDGFRCRECTADSACLNCAFAPEKPLLQGQRPRPSDAVLLGRRRRFRTPRGRPRRPPTQAQAERPPEDDAAREWKQAQIRDWLRRKDAEILRRRREQQAEDDLLREEEEYREHRRFEHEAELQRQRSWRLHMAELRRQELQMEMEHQIPAPSRETSGGKALGSKTLAAYSTPRIGPRRIPRLSRCCSSASRSARVSRGVAWSQ